MNGTGLLKLVLIALEAFFGSLGLTSIIVSFDKGLGDK